MMEQPSTENQSPSNIQLPFYNLFLNAGFVTGNNRPIRYLSTILITLFAYFTYQIFMGMVLLYYASKNGLNIYDTQTLVKNLMNPDAIGISKNFMLALLLGMFVFTFLAFYASIQKIHQKSLLSVITAYPSIRWNQVLFAFAVWSVVFLLMFFTDYLFFSPENYVLNFNASEFFVLLLISIAFLPIQTAFEEIFFRGYLMQGFALVFRNGILPLMMTSLLFGMAHLSNPETEKFGAWIMLPYYSLFGLFLGLLALWNNGLELSIGIHAANNILSALLITSKNTVLQTDAIFRIQQENPVIDFVLWLFGAVLALALFQYKYKFKHLVQLLK